MLICFNSCKDQKQHLEIDSPYYPSNVLDYSGTPDTPKDRSSLSYSDLGAWFSYGFPDNPNCYGGFSGPFLMTQENGVWISKVLSQLHLFDIKTNKKLDWKSFTVSHSAYPSHLVQVFENSNLKIEQTLAFCSSQSALISTHINNTSDKTFSFQPKWEGAVFLGGMKPEIDNNKLIITSERVSKRDHSNLRR